jgi:hypothetical protein
MDLLQSWAHIGFQSGQFGLLVIVVDGLLSFLPCLLAFGEERVPQPAQLFQVLRQQPLLALGGMQAVFEGLEHGSVGTPFIHTYRRIRCKPFFFTGCKLEETPAGGDVSSP